MNARSIIRAAAFFCLFSGCAPEDGLDVASSSRADEADGAVPSALQAQPCPYIKVGLETGTPLPETGNNFQFLVAANLDLFAIKKSATGTRSTEVHVLTAASNYQRYALQTGTALPETGDDFEFLLSANRDLIAIKKRNTGTGRTELHILSAASGYRTFVRQSATAFDQVGSDYDFEIAPNDDVVVIKKSPKNNVTSDVFVMSAAQNYLGYSRAWQTRGGIYSTDQVGYDWAAGVVFVFQGLKTGVPTVNGKSGVDVQAYWPTDLPGAGTRCGLWESTLPRGDYAFVFAPNRDVFAIKKSGTGTHSTEVHVMRR